MNAPEGFVWVLLVMGEWGLSYGEIYVEEERDLLHRTAERRLRQVMTVSLYSPYVPSLMPLFLLPS